MNNTPQSSTPPPEKPQDSQPWLSKFNTDVFTHFRNLGVVAAVMAVGIALLKSPSLLPTDSQPEKSDDFARLVGIINILVAVGLGILNSTSFFSWLNGFKKKVVVTGAFTGAPRGSGCIALIALAYLMVILSIIWISAMLVVMKLDK